MRIVDFLTKSNMKSLLTVLQSIVFNHPFPAELADNATTEERRKYSDGCRAYDTAQSKARKITVFTSAHEYTGIVTEVADDYFVMSTDKGDIRVMVAKVESFTFPDLHPRLIA